MKKTGRPTDYTEELGEEICLKLAEGKSLKKITAPKSMPHPSTVYRWVRKFATFRESYTQAREDQADAIMDGLLEEVENATNEDAQLLRIKIDTMKWISSKLKPRMYGDHRRETVEHTGDIQLRGILEHVAEHGTPLPGARDPKRLEGLTLDVESVEVEDSEPEDPSAPRERPTPRARNKQPPSAGKPSSDSSPE